MLGLFRGFLNTWAARAFFMLLVGSFVLWGVNDVVRNSGQDGSAATVGSEKISPEQLQDAYRNQLAQIARVTNNRPISAEERRRVAQLTLEQLVQNALVVSEARRLGIAAPDTAVRDAVFSIPAFRGPNGQFDRNILNNWLQQNQMTEARMLDIVRAGLLRDQLIAPLRAGVAAPEVLIRRAFAYQGQTRVAALVELPFDAAPEPAAPTDADLHALYDNNPGGYSAPEYRRIRAIILSPDTIARGIDVSDADIAAAYDANKANYVQPEKRAAQVVIAPNQALADKVAAAWKNGADWAAIGQMAGAADGTAVEFPDSTPDDLPSAEVRTAVFGAAPNTVTGPVPGPGGFLVLRVTNVVPPKNQTLAEAHDAIRDQVAHERAVQQLADKKDQLENELSSVASLQELPQGLSVTPVEGTLDAQGNTPAGEPAPIPGTPAVKQAIVAAAFQAVKGGLPVLTDGPDQTSFAITLEDTSPPKLRPFDQVKDQLTDDFDTAARRRTEEQAAAKLLTAAKASNLEDAATLSGLRVTHTAALHRGAPMDGVPTQLLEPMFQLKKNEPTMVETPDAFYVAAPVEITDPDPSSDPATASRLRTALNASLADDVEITYVNALRGRVQPQVNRQILDQLAQ